MGSMSQVVSLSEYRHEVPELVVEANHRIANQLTVLSGLVQSQIETVRNGPMLLSSQAVTEMLRDIAAKIASVGQLHRRLATPPQGARVNLGDFLIECHNQFIASLALGERLGTILKIGPECEVSAEHASILALMVGEIVMNAVKYAHPTGVPIELTMACFRRSDGSLALEISDDGVGLPEGFDERRDSGMGMKLIRRLAERIGGALDIESDDLGLTYRITLPPNP
jgi:two-component sensor histidine kinase